MRRVATLVLAAFALSMAAPAFAGPFSDVPNGHWAYKAIEKSVEAGILQGYDGKFHGGKTLNRYQMAVVVARMLDRIETMGPGKVGKKEIENLEALTIEFADELALLNVKVSTLEDGFAELKKDVEGLKKDYASGGANAGITGLFQGRMVMTDDDPSRFFGRGAGATAAPAATHPMARYIGTAPTGATGAAPNAISGEGRAFFNIAQTSVAFNRHYDEDYYIHAQLDFDADQETNFNTGTRVQVNEVYVDLEKWLADGDVRIRAGAWALPFDRERNPEMVEYPNQLRYGFRTLDLTVSPSLSGQNWERVRNVGAGLWNGKDSDFQWQVAAVNNDSGAGFRDGSLMTWQQAAFSRLNNGTFTGDALQSIENGATAGAGTQSEFGFYGWVGDKYEGGFRWDAGYFANGGTLSPGTGDIATTSDWSGFQFNAGYWGWENWGFMASFYGATSESGATKNGAAFNSLASGLVTANLNAATAEPDADSTSMSLLVNYKFNDDNNVSVRYEDATDEYGPAEYTARIWTFAWNHRMSSNSLLQLEWSTPESDARSATPNAAGTAYVANARNNIDVNDDLIQLNYKVRF